MVSEVARSCKTDQSCPRRRRSGSHAHLFVDHSRIVLIAGGYLCVSPSNWCPANNVLLLAPGYTYETHLISGRSTETLPNALTTRLSLVLLTRRPHIKPAYGTNWGAPSWIQYVGPAHDPFIVDGS